MPSGEAENFSRLVKQLKTVGYSDGKICKEVLGYKSDKNGDRNLLAVAEGRSRTCSLRDACSKMERIVATAGSTKAGTGGPPAGVPDASVGSMPPRNATIDAGVAATTNAQAGAAATINSHAGASAIADAQSGAAATAKAHEEAIIVYRILREDEVKSISDGLGILSRTGGVVKLPGAHVQAGSKARDKSLWVSTGTQHTYLQEWMVKNPRQTEGSIAAIRLQIADVAKTVTMHGDHVVHSDSELALRLRSRFGKIQEFEVPRVLDMTCDTKDTAALSILVNEHTRFPLHLGMGDSGRNFALSAGEVLIGASPGDCVVKPENIVSVGKLNPATGNIDWGGSFSPPDQAANHEKFKAAFSTMITAWGGKNTTHPAEYGDLPEKYATLKDLIQRCVDETKHHTWKDGGSSRKVSKTTIAPFLGYSELSTKNINSISEGKATKCSFEDACTVLKFHLLKAKDTGRGNARFLDVSASKHACARVAQSWIDELQPSSPATQETNNASAAAPDDESLPLRPLSARGPRN